MEEEVHHMKNHLLYSIIKVNKREKTLGPYTDASFLNADKVFSWSNTGVSSASAPGVCTITGKPTDT